MSEPSFAQHQSRSLVGPALIALAFAVIVFFTVRHFLPSNAVNLSVTHNEILPATTVFKSESIVLGPPQTQETLFVVPTIHIENTRDVPVSIDDYTLVITDPTGAQLSVKGAQKTEIPNIETSFPKITPLAANPLLRETSIDPGKSVDGTVIFTFDTPKSTWDTRKSAVITVDIYHGHPIEATIP